MKICPGEGASHEKHFIVGTGLAGVRGEGPLQIQGTAESGHIYAVELRLIQWIHQLNQPY